MYQLCRSSRFLRSSDPLSPSDGGCTRQRVIRALRLQPAALSASGVITAHVSVISAGATQREHEQVMTELISVSPRRSFRPFSRTAHGRSMRMRFKSPPQGHGSSYRIKISALNYRMAEFCFKCHRLWELNSLIAPENELRVSHLLSVVPPVGWRTESAACFNLNIRST